MGQMSWVNGVLHLRRNEGDRWQPYTSFPDLCQPDSTIPGASKGYPTMQALLKRGWSYAHANQPSKVGM